MFGERPGIMEHPARFGLAQTLRDLEQDGAAAFAHGAMEDDAAYRRMREMPEDYIGVPPRHGSERNRLWARRPAFEKVLREGLPGHTRGEP